MFVISMVCMKGGTGKTTLCLHLAVEAARRGARVLVVDIDAQQSSLRILARRGERAPDGVPNHASMLGKAVKDAEESGYDIMVIDAPPHADQAPLAAAKLADLVVVPLRPSLLDVDAIKATMEICELARKRPVFVLNQVPATGIEADQTAEVIEGRGAYVAKTRIGLRKVFAQAFTLAMTAQEYAPSGPAAREIIALFDELGIPVHQAPAPQKSSQSAQRKPAPAAKTKAKPRKIAGV